MAASTNRITSYNVCYTKLLRTFNPDFFIYFDDIEWCTRVKNSGYAIDALKSAKVWHKGGAREAANTIGPYYFTRNNLKFFSKYMLPSQLEIFIEKMTLELSKMIV